MYTLFGDEYGIGNVADIEKANCDVIGLMDSSPDMDAFIASILLMGFFMGAEDKAQEIASDYEYFYDEAVRLGKTIKVEDKKKVAWGTATKSNQYVQKVLQVGGEYAFEGATAPESWGSYTPGDWMYKYQVDKMLSLTYGNAGNGSFYKADSLNEDALISNVSSYEQMQCYKDGNIYFLSGEIPMPLQLAVVGYVIYPEVFGDLYDEMLDSFGKSLGKGYAYDGWDLFVSLEDLKAM